MRLDSYVRFAEAHLAVAYACFGGLTRLACHTASWLSYCGPVIGATDCSDARITAKTIE